MQKPRKSARKSKGRFIPKSSFISSSFVDHVLEVLTDPDSKTTREASDRCFRLNGELITLPQNEEEEKVMDKALWDYMMQRTSNNISQLIETSATTSTDVAGETMMDDEESVRKKFKDLSVTFGQFS